MWAFIQVVKVLLTGLLARWWAGRTQQKEIASAVEPYKAESAALAAAPDSKSDTIERLRGDIS